MGLSQHRHVRAFAHLLLRELKKIKIAWPDVNYATDPGVLILYPSTPAIEPSPRRLDGPLGCPNR